MQNPGKLILEYKKAYKEYLEDRNNQYNAGKIDGMSFVMLCTGFIQVQLNNIQQEAALEYFSE